MVIKLHNTLTNKKEEFIPLEKGVVKMYNCGPTVYGPQHIGNLSMFVFTDVLRKTLEYGGFKVDQVINFTDVGHLSGDNEGDADTGEDRMTKGLKRDGLEINLENMISMGRKYSDIFLKDISLLNIDTEKIQFPRASDYIKEQIEMVKTLEEKGFAYAGRGGLYFDTKKFPDYGKLGPASAKATAGKQLSRLEVNSDKKDPKDFLLWKSDDKIGWPSPWGQGFPGWHIECSAMICKILGEQIDIHTGGIEHISIHHNNEIAQAESTTGKSPFSKFWMHRAHMKMNDEKLAKSTGNVLFLEDLMAKGIHPMSFRYWLLTAHYATSSNFTLDAVLGAQNALEKIISEYSTLPRGALDTSVVKDFEEAIADDLNTPVAVALLQQAKSQEEIDAIDKVLGLNIKKLAEDIKQVPDNILDLQKQREQARTEKAWQKSDDLRKQIENAGYRVMDSDQSSKILNSLSNLANLSKSASK